MHCLSIAVRMRSRAGCEHAESDPGLIEPGSDTRFGEGGVAALADEEHEHGGHPDDAPANVVFTGSFREIRLHEPASSEWTLDTLKGEGLLYEPSRKTGCFSGSSVWEGRTVYHPERDLQREEYVRKWSRLDHDTRVQTERSLAQEVGEEWRQNLALQRSSAVHPRAELVQEVGEEWRASAHARARTRARRHARMHMRKQAQMDCTTRTAHTACTHRRARRWFRASTPALGTRRQSQKGLPSIAWASCVWRRQVVRQHLMKLTMSARMHGRVGMHARMCRAS